MVSKNHVATDAFVRPPPTWIQRQPREKKETMSEKPVTLGVISDTHGLLRSEAVEALRGSDRILHAGTSAIPKFLGGSPRLLP